MTRQILKFIVIAVTAAVIGYVGLTVYGEVTKAEAAKMAGSVELAKNQAGNMNRALDDVSSFAAGESRTGDSERQAWAESSDTARIADIDAVIALWEPKYDRAKIAYLKLESAIEIAKSSAAGYFAAQQAITERINDADIKSRARQDDERDLELYRQWEHRAETVLAEARAIGARLDDMDSSLRKLELRADFVFDASTFDEVPSAITDLNRELVDFQAASESIRTAT